LTQACDCMFCYSLHTTCPCGTASTTRSWRRCAVYIEVSSCQWAVI
jgi:hypothetical protein